MVNALAESRWKFGSKMGFSLWILKMKFDYILRLLNNNINGHPREYRDEVDFVIDILTKGQGYLTKDKPVRVIFYDDRS